MAGPIRHDFHKLNRLPPYVLAEVIEMMKSARRAAYITHILTGVLEFIRFAPKGTQAVHTMLLKAAVNLEAGGDLGIFSPMYLIVMKKPVA